MNIFNRVFTIVSLVVLAIFGAATLVTPDQVLLFVNNTASFIHISVFAGMLGTGRVAIRLLIAIIFVTVILVLMWLETRRGGSRHVDVAKSSGGQIRIHTSDVEERIAQQVDAISGILTCRVHVNEHERAVIAKLDVQAAPGIDLVSKGEEVAAITRIVVQDQLGLKLKDRPLVTMKSGKLKAIPEATVKTSPIKRNDANASDKA
jgi:hypothetical protein